MRKEKSERSLLSVSGRAINISDAERSRTTQTQRSRTLWEGRCDVRRGDVGEFLRDGRLSERNNSKAVFGRVGGRVSSAAEKSSYLQYSTCLV